VTGCECGFVPTYGETYTTTFVKDGIVQVMCNGCRKLRIYTVAGAPQSVRDMAMYSVPFKVKNIGIF
jgi:hypothetical protein